MAYDFVRLRAEDALHGVRRTRADDATGYGRGKHCRIDDGRREDSRRVLFAHALMIRKRHKEENKA